MISHCANPECGAPFHYLRGGRLYRFEINPAGQGWREVPNAISTVKPPRASVYFWLCEECSVTYSLKFTAKRGLVLGRLARGTKPPRSAPVVIDGESEAEERQILACPQCRPESIYERR